MDVKQSSKCNLFGIQIINWSPKIKLDLLRIKDSLHWSVWHNFYCLRLKLLFGWQYCEDSLTSFGLVSQTTKEKEENLLSRKQWSVDSSILCKCYMSPSNSLLPWTAYDAPQINWNLNHKHKALKIGSQDCMWLLILHNFHSIEQNWRLYNDARR